MALIAPCRRIWSSRCLHRTTAAPIGFKPTAPSLGVLKHAVSWARSSPAISPSIHPIHTYAPKVACSSMMLLPRTCLPYHAVTSFAAAPFAGFATEAPKEPPATNPTSTDPTPSEAAPSDAAPSDAARSDTTPSDTTPSDDTSKDSAASPPTGPAAESAASARDPSSAEHIEAPESSQGPTVSHIKAPATKRRIAQERARATASRGPLNIRAVAITALMAALAVAYYNYEQKRLYEDAKSFDSTGDVLIGGDFELTDIDGNDVTMKSFAGKYLLIYFGFTFCAEICPVELEKMGIALHTLKQYPDITETVVPLFITVDPQRDTNERMREYSKKYHPDLIWLRGTDEQLTDVTRKFRVYYSKPPENEKDYQVDHSIYYYLMNPDGKFLEYFGKQLPADEVAIRMRTHIIEDRNVRRERAHQEALKAEEARQQAAE